MLKLKLQYFGHLMQRANPFEKTLMLGKTEEGGEGDNRGWDGWMASPTQWTWVCVNSGRWWWTWRPGVLQFMVSQRVGHNWVTELNWTELRNWRGKKDVWSWPEPFSLMTCPKEGGRGEGKKGGWWALPEQMLWGSSVLVLSDCNFKYLCFF